MAEEKDLPGWPRKKLVKAVRSHLWSYGIRPCLYPHFSKHWTPWLTVLARKGLAALSCFTVTHFGKVGGSRTDACVPFRRSCP